MEVDTDRMVRDPDDDQCYILYAKADNEPIFRGKAELWPLVKSLWPRCYFGELGTFAPSTPAQIVRVFESGVFYTKSGVYGEDLRRDLRPLVVTPTGYRRLLKIAWATNERLIMEPISLPNAGLTQKSGRRFPRLVPPGAPGQPIAFRRSFADYPCSSVRFLVATWESPPVVSVV